MSAKKITVKIKLGQPKKLILVFSLLLTILLPIAGFQVYYLDRIYPGVKVVGIDLAGLEVDQAAITLNEKVNPPKKVVIVSEDQKFPIPLADIETKYDLAKSAQNAYRIGKSGNILFDLQEIFKSASKGKNIGLEVKVNEEKLAKNISVISGAVETETIYPSVSLVNNQVVVNPGKSGTQVDEVKLRLDIGQELSYLGFSQIEVKQKIIDPSLSPSEEIAFQRRAEKIIASKDGKDKTLKLTFEFEEFTFSKEKLLSFLNAKEKYNQELITTEAGNIAIKLNRDPQNATFSFSEGRVQEFSPAKEGIKVKTELLAEEIQMAIEKLEINDEKEVRLVIPTQKTQPQIQTSDVNNLGIKELIGRGTSLFRGSIPARIYNVNLATTRINGTLAKPGEVVSFNKIVGDVSKETGFKEAYIIQSGRTVLGDGGGVCQVSTTLFRAAMNAGLPIEERRAHAYRVGYYEQDAGPGLDATVFSPTTDFKFVNNTPGHILIQTKADLKNLSLTFEIYGTSDGRIVTITKPQVLSQTAPPSDIYQEDPTLPTGVVKQVEHRAWGAKTVFNYSVVRDGDEIYKKTFTSVYKPWAAVYLKGTAI